MLEWKDAAPLIGVLVTAFLGLIGILVAKGKREGEPRAASHAVPAAIAGAVAERGIAEGLTLAIAGLTGVLTDHLKAFGARHDDDQKLRKEQFDDILEELRRVRLLLEVRRN